MALGDRLAVVIVTHNRVQGLLQTLDHLHRLEEEVPILVIDNASTDGTAEHVRRAFPRVRVLVLGKNMGAVARTYGLRLLRQQYIAISDDDAWWAPGSLSRAVELFDRHPRLALIMSRILVGPEVRLDPCCELMAQSPLPRPQDLPGVPILGFVGCGVVMRREAVLAAGGFHSRMGTGGEEALLAIDLARAGWGLAYVPEVVSHHHPSSRRNAGARISEGLRNELWTSWLRRSPGDIARRTLRHARRAVTSKEIRTGLVQAFRGLPWVVRERDRMPALLERQIECLERQGLELNRRARRRSS